MHGIYTCFGAFLPNEVFRKLIVSVSQNERLSMICPSRSSHVCLLFELLKGLEKTQNLLKNGRNWVAEGVIIHSEHSRMQPRIVKILSS